MNDFPIDFRDQIASGKSAQPISAAALMQNYAWAKLVADDSYLQDTTLAGFPAKKLNLPPIPSTGIFVLGSVEGSLQWIDTEECP
jgi:hypothetical protein